MENYVFGSLYLPPYRAQVLVLYFQERLDWAAFCYLVYKLEDYSGNTLTRQAFYAFRATEEALV